MSMSHLGRFLAFTLCALGFFFPLRSLFAHTDTGSQGIFEGQTDVGSVTPPGTLKHDPATGMYSMTAAGANIWHLRDDFHFAWKKMSGDVSLAADINFPVQTGKHEEHRKAALMIRRNLDFDGAYVDVAQHGSGMTALQYRKENGGTSQSIELNIDPPKRVRIEKRGDVITMFVSKAGEPLHQVGASIYLHFDGPFYVGIGLSAHNAAIMETATFSNLELKQLMPPATQPKLVLYSTLQYLPPSLDRSTVVTSQPVHLFAPNWTPDKKSLVFTQDGAIYKIAVDGSSQTPLDLGASTGCTGSHGFSPDGKWFAATCGMDGKAERRIYIFTAGGGVPRQLTDASGAYFHSWSPDGKTILFTRGGHGSLNIYSIPAEGGPEKALTSGTGVSDDPDYSPDGQYIYFNTDRWGGMQIARMHADGSNPEQITFDQFKNWTPHPSPDGKWIAFLSYDKDVTGHPANENIKLRVYSIGKQKVHAEWETVGGDGTMNVPSWSADSKSLAFVSYQMYPADDHASIAE